MIALSKHQYERWVDLTAQPLILMVPKVTCTIFNWQSLKVTGKPFKKSKLNDLQKKKSGAAETRTHDRGSVPLMSKSDANPLRHEAKTFDVSKTTKYIVTVCSNSDAIKL